MSNLAIVILAAGKGTRMKSDLPKVCHKVGNKTMIEHVVSTSENLNPKTICVVVSKDNIESIKSVLTGYKIRFKIQYEQLGTGHAVTSAIPCYGNNNLLVLLGDVPLIKTKTLEKIINTDCDAVIVGFKDNNHKNKFGRIVIKNKRVDKIVEYNDATDEEKKINLCNSGMLWLKSDHVPLLSLIENDNNKNEYYLTDIIKIMVDKGLDIGFLEISRKECTGVNTQEDLIEANKIYRKQNK